MDKRVFRHWLRALRSSNYNQGYTRLRVSDPDDGDKYCAIGVLGDVLTKYPEYNIYWVPPNKGYYWHLFTDAPFGSLSTIRQEVLDTIIPVNVYRNIATKLMPIDLREDTHAYRSIYQLNDDRRLSFNQIADVLEIVAIQLGHITLEELTSTNDKELILA